MTNKQIAELIKNACPDVPEGFHERSDLHLSRLFREEKHMKKRFKLSTVLAAALVIVLLAGAALAATELKIFDFLFARTSLPEAAALVETGLGSAEGSGVRMIAEEAVYDGKTVGLVLLVSPLNPENGAVLYGTWMLQENLEDEYHLTYTQTGEDSGFYRLDGRKDGKEIYVFSPVFSINGEELLADASAEGLSDGSIRVWLQYNVENALSAKTVECALSGRVKPYHEEGSPSLLPEISFSLTRKADERSYLLTPVEGNDHERVRITDAYVTFAKLMGYLEIGYDYTPIQGEEMGIDFQVFTEDGTRLDTASGEGASLGNGKYALTSEIQSVSEIPETLCLKAKVIGENRILTEVKCRLSELDEVRLPSLLPESKEEKPLGLILIPETGTQSGRIRFLEGYLMSGMRIYIAFSYDGAREDAARIEIRYKDSAGKPFSDAVASTGIIKNGYIALNQTLDGNMWPYPMTIVFTLDGQSLAEFTFTYAKLIPSDGQTAEQAFASYPLLSSVDEACVFIRENDMFYHTRPSCGGEASSSLTNVESARGAGKTPCKSCCGN